MVLVKTMTHYTVAPPSEWGNFSAATCGLTWHYNQNFFCVRTRLQGSRALICGPVEGQRADPKRDDNELCTTCTITNLH